jgi:maltose phosphorylase
MAGTWMSIVEGFGGMRIKDDMLSFEPKIPNQWDSYSFKINFRNQVLIINVTKSGTRFELSGEDQIDIVVKGEIVTISPNILVTV